jgi:[lysine-biosynthesis-protein LysW]--L-2-aminoadipate ligase
LTETNRALLPAFRRLGVWAEWLPPDSSHLLGPGDVVLARFDVLRTLDGVEPGVWALRRAARQGVTILNGIDALLTTHDKLATALTLRRSGLAHPRTAHVDGTDATPPLPLPVVVKPRFGSWGADVVLCESRAGYRGALERLSGRHWFRRQGALVQELVPPAGFDLRIVVAGGQVVGSVERRAAAGEWRTNVALGGRRVRAVASRGACELALAAARAVAGDLVGVDLLPAPGGGWAVVELNGAVDFTREYSLGGGNVFDDAAWALSARAGLAREVAASRM